MSEHTQTDQEIINDLVEALNGIKALANMAGFQRELIINLADKALSKAKQP